MELLEKLSNLLSKLKLVENRWVESNDGTDVIVKQEEIDNIQKTLEQTQKSMKDLVTSTQGLTENARKELLEKVEQLGKSVSSGNPEIIATVSAICEKGLGELNKLGTLNVSEFKTPEQLKQEKIARGEAENDGKVPSGGDITIISTTGYENQPNGKNKEDNKDKKIGAGIVSGKNKEYQQELEGEYLKKEKVLEIVNGIIDASLKEIEKISSENGIDTKNIENLINKNMDNIKENLKQSAVGKKEQVNGTLVTSTKRLTARALMLLFAVGMTFSAAMGYVANKNGNYSISTDKQIESTFDDNTEELEEIARDAIEKKAEHEEDAAKEEMDNGSLAYKDEELITRETETQNYEELENVLEEIERIEEDYKTNSNPSNLDHIEYEEAIKEKENEIIDLIIATKQGDNTALDKWIEENCEHIDKMSTQKDIDEHLAQNTNSEKLKQINEKDISELEILKEQNQERIEFNSQIKNILNLESIENIENFSESVYNFYSENKDKVSLEELTDFLNKDDRDLDLFAAHTKVNEKTENMSDFFGNFVLLENTYNEYVSEYCDGDKTKVDEGQFAEYFSVAKDNYMQDLGENEGPIGKFGQKLDQNTMNKRFWEQTTGNKQKFVENCMQLFKTIIDGTRSSEFNEAIEQVTEIQQEKNLNKQTQQETDSNKQIQDDSEKGIE